MKDYIFKREKDIKVLERALSIPKIKVISGLRRAGKSFLLDPLFKDYLIDNRGCTEDEFETMNFSEQDAIDLLYPSTRQFRIRSISSEKRLIKLNALDRLVPPLKVIAFFQGQRWNR